VESDLALLTLAAHHDAVTETDGTLEPHPAWLKVPEAYARFIGRGPGVIPDLMRIA
jgi:uncharacterized protein YciI